MTVIRAQDEPEGPHDPGGVVMQALRKASPSFQATWQAEVADWDPEGVPQYLAVGAFARHLVEQLKLGSTDEWPEIFDTIERLLANDDPGIRYLVTWGLIEGIGNVASNTVGWESAHGLRSWFRSQTTEAWDEVHRFWGTDREDPPSRDLQQR